MKGDPWAEDGQPVELGDVEHAEMERWLKAAAQLLGLGNHDIHLSNRQADGSVVASSYFRENSTEQWIAVGKLWRTKNADQQRCTLAHELLHAYFQPVHSMMWRLATDEFGNTAQAFFKAAVQEVEEREIDRLARAIANFLPKT